MWILTTVSKYDGLFSIDNSLQKVLLANSLTYLLNFIILILTEAIPSIFLFSYY
jgi:hypothetical protein